MDGFGNLTRVEEPKPATGTYVTLYTYNEFNRLRTVSTNRDGYNGNTQLSVAQVRTFTYDANQRLATTTFPETPGATTYTYNTDGTLFTKTDYKGVRKYFYTAAKQLMRVEKYPGGGAEDINARIYYYYDSHPLTTDFVAQYTQGRLAAISYGGVNEFYSYTRGRINEEAAGEPRREAGSQLRVRCGSEAAIHGLSERRAREVHV